MSQHNKSSSSDESWEKLAINYDEFDVLLTDIDEVELMRLGRDNEVEHLSTGTFSSPPFPARGRIHRVNIRYMIPLVCQRAGISLYVITQLHQFFLWESLPPES